MTIEYPMWRNVLKTTIVVLFISSMLAFVQAAPDLDAHQRKIGSDLVKVSQHPNIVENGYNAVQSGPFNLQLSTFVAYADYFVTWSAACAAIYSAISNYQRKKADRIAKESCKPNKFNALGHGFWIIPDPSKCDPSTASEVLETAVSDALHPLKGVSNAVGCVRIDKWYDYSAYVVVKPSPDNNSLCEGKGITHKSMTSDSTRDIQHETKGRDRENNKMN